MTSKEEKRWILKERSMLEPLEGPRGVALDSCLAGVVLGKAQSPLVWNTELSAISCCCVNKPPRNFVASNGIYYFS